jgi:hypothetical protein
MTPLAARPLRPAPKKKNHDTTSNVRKLKKALVLLVDSAHALGLRDEDAKNALGYLEYHEWGLCFDIVITQLYEYGIKIDVDFYTFIEQIGQEMKLPADEYSYMRELVREGYRIPDPVKAEILRIISSFRFD